MTDCMPSELDSDSGQPTTDIWRKEVHTQLSKYRTRRGRRIEGAFTMRFPFPTDEPSATERAPELPSQPPEPMLLLAADVGATIIASAVAPDQGDEAIADVFAPDLMQVSASAPSEPEPQPAPVPHPRQRRKVIAFPRQVEAYEPVQELPDPLPPEQPRILDVREAPETPLTTPFLEGLQFGPNPQPSNAVHADHVDLPFRAVPLSQRVFAAVIDCAVIAVAAILFAGVGYKLLPKVHISKPIMLTAALIPALLWAIYQYLLTVYSGATVGMTMAGIRMSTFKGKQPRLGDRRNRILALYLSTASLGMGLLWAFVDVDALCWHDRISRTYLTPRE